MQTLLSSEGYAVDSARSPEEADAALALARPDLIIADVRLPGSPPFAILDLVKASEKTRDIPLLLCSGATQEIEEAGARLEEMGVTVLMKPFDIDDLLSRIAALLD